MTQKDPLYFIAWVPGDPVQQEVTAFKREIAARFNSHHALKAPSHITLLPPFRAGAEKVSVVCEHLHALCAETQAFDLVLNGIDAFEPRVIFVSVEQITLLAELYKRLEGALLPIVTNGRKKRYKRPYHPHMTIANRDLSEEMFYKAYLHFRSLSYRREVIVASLQLLRHNGLTWDVWKDFPFGAT